MFKDNRTEKIISLLVDFIKKNERIIDIGAGSCIIAKEIQNRKNIEIVPVDIIDYNRTDLKLILYNGEKLPFKDRSFDTSLLIFTLHHCNDFVEMLKEAKRVTGKKIVVIEDIYSTKIGKILLRVWDLFTNLFASKNLPFNFKTEQEWEALFKKLNLKIKHRKIFKSIRVINHILFVLEK